MEKDLGRKITDLKVDGGASLNNFLMQNQADISDIHIVRHKSIESTSLGAAYLAGLASGYYKSIEDIIEIKDIDKEFYSAIEDRRDSVLRLSGIGLLRLCLGWQRMRNSRGKESLLVVVRIKENGDVCTQTSPFLASF